MHLQAHPCPNCGAPLRIDAQTVLTACVYCNSSVTVTRDAQGRESLAPDRALDPSQVEAIKRLLFEGRRAEAIAAYASCKPGASASEAEQAIAGYAQNLSVEALGRAMMSAKGWVLWGLFVAALVAGVSVAIAVPGQAVVGGIVAALAAVPVLIAAPLAARTLRYAGAPEGTATVLHQIHVARFGAQHTVRMHLRVEPRAGAAFEVDLTLPVRDDRRAKIVEGYRMRVKYLPGEPESVRYVGEV